jgi:hypothetical protein
VWTDGKKVAIVNLYSSEAQPRRMDFTRSWETSDRHTMTIKVLGKKKSASSGKRVYVDAFVALR